MQKLKNCKLLHCSTRSIRNKLSEVSAECVTHAAQVICVTETWLPTYFAPSTYAIDSHSAFFNFRQHGNGSGVAIYVSNTLLSTQLLIDDRIEHSYSICAVAVGDRRHRNLIVTIYRLPNSSLSDTVDLCNVLCKLCVNYNKIIVVGDFNSPSHSQNLMNKGHFRQKSL